jgi:thioredoxin reductase (NADPH)
MSDPRNTIIIGSGPAGFTAAIYAARASLRPLLIEGEPAGMSDQPGGQLMYTTTVENFPGRPAVQGPELMADMREQARQFGTEIITKRATRVDLASRPFGVWVGDDEYRAHTLIVATGAHALMLGLGDEQRLLGRGVSTCATCDGFFFRGQDIAVVGGGDAAMEEATFLTKFADSVTLIVRRDTLRASQVMQDRAKANSKIKFLWNSEVIGLAGDEKLASLTIRDNLTGSTAELPMGGLFVAIGHKPNSELFTGQLDLDPLGYIKTTGVKTSVDGVFAAGDVADRRYRQAITSAGTGCMASLDAQAFLAEHDERGHSMPPAAKAQAKTTSAAHTT